MVGDERRPLGLSYSDELYASHRFDRAWANSQDKRGSRKMTHRSASCRDFPPANAQEVRLWEVATEQPDYA
jgi:hypothetical protein